MNGTTTYYGPTGTWQIVAAVRGGGTINTYNSVGGYYTGREYKGDVAEVIIYNRALTSLEQNQVGYYLASKYNVATSYSPPGPEINVKGNGQSISDGDNTPGLADDTDFGAAPVEGGQVVRTFTIENAGDATLNLSGDPRVSVSGDVADFTVTVQPSDTVAVGGSTTFQVTFDPSATGQRTATLSIANDDSNENPYDFAIQGQGAGAGLVSATGGTISDVGGYRIHTFTSNGTFQVTDGGSADVLIVGGGGGGGMNYGGGGGGGSVVLTLVALNNETHYPIVVGIGGASGTGNGVRGVNGGSSSAFSLTATGGGGGASYSAAAGSAGTGGGGSRNTPTPGTGTPPGGNGGTGGGAGGGGGGGARGNGQASTATRGGDGGVGVSSTISGAPVGYGGGGGGGVRGASGGGGSGVDGGGNGSPSDSDFAQSGTPNTGGGAGGQSGSFTPGLKGGDGVVIVRYALPDGPEMNVTGNGQSIAAGADTPSLADHTDFGGAYLVGDQVARTFTIENAGNEALTLSGTPRVSVSGTHAADFTVTDQPSGTVEALIGSTTFEVTFNPSALGLRTATLSIVNNDADENPYNFAIQGFGVGLVSATGGNTTNEFGGYRIHSFTNDGTFTITPESVAGLVDVLIVGGGGGGGINYGGGGGGGSVILTNLTLTSGSYAIVVGSGGTSGTGNGVRGVNGGSSSAFSLTATGGGGGASYSAAAGSAGTGGGGSGGGGFAGAGTPPGGSGGLPYGSKGGGGGGGARGNGQAATLTKAGDGGVGVSSDISGGTVLYGGGGGGGARGGGAVGGSGVYGGGRGANIDGDYADSGAPNTGGGAGGQSGLTPGLKGGDGVVIVRYALSAEPEMNVKGNGQTIADGDTTPSTGDHTDFGTALVAGDPVVRTFTIENTGNAALNLSGDPKVSVSGDDADFTVTVEPSDTGPGGRFDDLRGDVQPVGDGRAHGDAEHRQRRCGQESLRLRHSGRRNVARPGNER